MVCAETSKECLIVLSSVLEDKFGSSESITYLYSMTDREIIVGLMLKLEEENVNVLALSKRIGYSNYKKWQKAHDAAFEVLEEEKKK